MTPTQTATMLRRIASALDASTNPDRRLVTRALRQVLAAMGAERFIVFEGAKDPGAYQISDASDEQLADLARAGLPIRLVTRDEALAVEDPPALVDLKTLHHWLEKKYF